MRSGAYSQTFDASDLTSTRARNQLRSPDCQPQSTSQRSIDLSKWNDHSRSSFLQLHASTVSLSSTIRRVDRCSLRNGQSARKYSNATKRETLPIIRSHRSQNMLAARSCVQQQTAIRQLLPSTCSLRVALPFYAREIEQFGFCAPQQGMRCVSSTSTRSESASTAAELKSTKQTSVVSWGVGALGGLGHGSYRDQVRNLNSIDDVVSLIVPLFG